MRRLDEITWDEGNGLEALIGWGIKPLQAFVRFIEIETNGTAGESNEHLESISYVMEETLDNMERCIFRLMEEVKVLKR